MGNSLITCFCPFVLIFDLIIIDLHLCISAKDKHYSLTGYSRKGPLFCFLTKHSLLTLIRYVFSSIFYF